MRGNWIRRLLPASVLGIVLAFSYFAPALGFVAPPVNSAAHTNCGRFGYGYHGGKHDFVCPTHGPKPAGGAQAPPSTRVPPAVGANILAGSQQASTQQAAAPRTSIPSAAAPARKGIVDSGVTDGLAQWRAFVDLVVTELSVGT